MKRTLNLIIILCLASLILLAGCYEPGGPVPEGAHKPVKRDYTQQQVDAVVIMEEQVISSPLPPAWGAPPECNDIHFLRFRPRDGTTLDPRNRNRVNTATTAAMLVMLPGILEGANGFEYLARQLIYMAKVQNGVNMEVWAVERRNNRLEDLTAVNYLENKLLQGQLNVDQAVDTFVGYYYKGKPLNGKSFKGFLLNEDVPFLSEFGLKLDTEDVFTVIQTMVPDPNMRKKKVFVGGHSMGGPMAAYFAGWDLDGKSATTGDAGYNNCAGLFGFDSRLGPMDSFTGGLSGATPGSLSDQTLGMTESEYASQIDDMRNGSYAVILNSPPLLGAESMDLLEANSLSAYFAPDDEATYFSSIPWSDDIKLLNRIINSRDLGTFILGIPEIQDFRLTNEAVLGMNFDDSFVPLGMIQNSMGFLQGGPVVEKEFPMAMLRAIPGLPDMFGGGTYYIPNDAGPCCFMLGCGPLYSWVNFDEIGNACDPNYQDTQGTITYTTMENEVTDIHDVARAIHRGPFNLVEWYFSNRLLVDFDGAGTSYGPKYGLNYLYGDKVPGMPQVLFLAGDGTRSDTDLDDLPGEVYLLKGYNHMDVLMASANTSTRRPNGVIRPLIDFILENL